MPACCSGRRRGPGTSSPSRSPGITALRGAGRPPFRQDDARGGRGAEHPRRAAAAAVRGLSRRPLPVVGVLAGRVIGRVDHVHDLRDLLLDGLRDAFLERRGRGGAAVAASAHLQDHGVARHVDDLDEAAVRGDRRVDLEVEHALDLLADHFLDGQGRFEAGLMSGSPLWIAARIAAPHSFASVAHWRGPVLGHGDDRARDGDLGHVRAWRRASRRAPSPGPGPFVEVRGAALEDQAVDLERALARVRGEPRGDPDDGLFHADIT